MKTACRCSYRLTLAITLFVLGHSKIHAHPYASQITNDNGVIRFMLNEGGGTVTVAYDNDTATNALGTLNQGWNSFSLGAHSNYSIIVSIVGSGVAAQISVDATNNSFFGPRGVAVNRNPKNHYFGRIYVANANPGIGTTAPSQTTGRGIYILNADTTDALGRGTNASLAGIAWGSSTTYAPYKLFVGPDDNVYIGDSSGLNTGLTTEGEPVSMANPDVTVSTKLFVSGSSVSSNNAGPCQSTPIATGSLAASNLVLYVNLWNYFSPPGTTYNNILQYNIGGGPVPWSNAPVALGNAGNSPVNGVVGDLYLSPDGKFFALQNRSSAAPPNVSLRIFASDGVTQLWDSSTASGGNDPFATAFGVAVSPDTNYVAVIVNPTSSFFVVAKLVNGLPDLTQIVTNATGIGTTARGIAIDAADNVYVTSGGNDRLRVFSLGLTTMAVTYNDATGTNGAFQLIVPSASVSVAATTPQASQGYGTPLPGVFTLTRMGQNLNFPLTAYFALGGTASNSTYTISGASATEVTFAAGESTTNITITPVADNIPRLTNTVTLTVHGGPNYSPGMPSTDTIFIQNTAPQQLVVTASPAPAMYKPHTNDFATFVITRMGDVNVPDYMVSNFTYAGSAVRNVDFLAAEPVNIGQAMVTVTNYIANSPVYTPAPYHGNKTIVVGMGSDVTYTILTNTVTLTILDNAYPPATVLLSDPLTDPGDGVNWKITFGNGDVTNNPADYEVDFGWDLTANNMTNSSTGVIPPPPGGATNAMRITCNKSYNPGSAAGVNVYYTNAILKGNYAVRFNMNLIQGGNLVYATEGVLFGINHNGSESNWWSGSGPSFGGPWASDGIWYWVSSDAAGASAGDFMEFTGAGGMLPNSGWQRPAVRFWTEFANVFKAGPGPFTSTSSVGQRGGVPANATPVNGFNASTWSDVELKQVNGRITLTIDKTPIFAFTNTTTFTSGYLMLGYGDPFGGTGGVSVGNPDGAVYLANLRAVSLANPAITGISLGAGNVLISFVSNDGDDTPASFALQSTASISSPFADVSPPAAISQLADGSFQAVAPASGSAQLYRIRHK